MGVNDKLGMIKAEVNKLAGTQRIMADKHRVFQGSIKASVQGANDVDTAEL